METKTARPPHRQVAIVLKSGTSLTRSALAMTLTLLAPMVAWASSDRAQLCGPLLIPNPGEHPLVTELRRNPGALYLNVRKRAQAAQAQGMTSFSFPEMAPFLEHILADATHRLNTRLNPVLAPHFEAHAAEARRLLAAGVPYHDAIRFGFRYTHDINVLFHGMRPDLARQTYNRSLAEGLLEPSLARAPEVIPFATFAPVDKRFFLETASSGLILYGFDYSGTYPEQYDDGARPTVPFADGYDLAITEFPYHDVGHADYIARLFLQYVEEDGRSMEAIIGEMTENRDVLLGVVDNARTAGDIDLADAAEELLFEILHERGYNYLTVASLPQLQTDQWIDVILRKRARNYYQRIDHNPRLFDRLRDARVALLAALSTKAAQRHASEFRTVLASSATGVPLIAHAETRSLTGAFKRVYFNGGDRHQQGEFELGDGSTALSDLYTLPLAQIDAIKNTPLQGQVLRRLELVLEMSRRGLPLATAFGEAPELIQNVDVDSTGLITVHFASGKSSLLSALELPALAGDVPALDPLGLFKINQLLNIASSNTALTFNNTPPARRLNASRLPNLERWDLLRVDWARIAPEARP